MIGIIHNDAEYQAAMDRLEALLTDERLIEDAERDERQLLRDERQMLVLVLWDYERTALPLGPLPSPIDAIRFRMEQQDLVVRDLVPYMGTISHIYEVLSGKRPLSLRMIRRLHARLGIPLDVLIQEQRP